MVENGLIKGLSAGSTTIYANVKGKENRQSVNKIQVEVIESDFIPVTSISYNQTIFYQYEPVDILPEFNKDASDTNFTILVDKLDAKINNNKIPICQNFTISKQYASIFQ